MAAKRYKAVAIDEKNVKAPDEHVKIIEKDMPRPGNGEVLVRVFLRPVSVALQPRHLRTSLLRGICISSR